MGDSPRQVILDILVQYRNLDFPSNPELLRLHIDNATDRLDAIYQGNDLAKSDSEAATAPVESASGAPKSTGDELDMLYNPEITDLEKNEYQGIHRPVIYLDEAKAHIDAVVAELLDELEREMPVEQPASSSVYTAHYRDNRPHDCDYTLQIQLNNEMNKGFNQAIEIVKQLLKAKRAQQSDGKKEANEQTT